MNKNNLKKYYIFFRFFASGVVGLQVRWDIFTQTCQDWCPPSIILEITMDQPIMIKISESLNIEPKSYTIEDILERYPGIKDYIDNAYNDNVFIDSVDVLDTKTAFLTPRLYRLFSECNNIHSWESLRKLFGIKIRSDSDCYTDYSDNQMYFMIEESDYPNCHLCNCNKHNFNCKFCIFRAEDCHKNTEICPYSKSRLWLGRRFVLSPYSWKWEATPEYLKVFAKVSIASHTFNFASVKDLLDSANPSIEIQICGAKTRFKLSNPSVDESFKKNNKGSFFHENGITIRCVYSIPWKYIIERINPKVETSFEKTRGLRQSKRRKVMDDRDLRMRVLSSLPFVPL